jgi:hypothetical protein
MKTNLIVSLCMLLCSNVDAQKKYFQQKLNYRIEAVLNDQEKIVRGHETIIYKNNSGDALNFIWFHVYPNALKSENTAFIKQLRKDKTRSKKDAVPGTGYIDSMAFTINDAAAKTEVHPNPDYIDIIKLVLNKPLLPGDSISISTAFKTKLPPYASRSGYADGEFMVCQWYPKPAVYDATGWHEFPYLDMGEFYSEYGDYSVNITLPATYIVGATGVLKTEKELAAYKTTGAINTVDRKSKPALYIAENPSQNKTLNYRAENVLDFAWFAAKDFVVQYDTIRLTGGKTVDAFSYYHNKKSSLWKNSIDYVKDAVKFYGNGIGEYAYPVVQAVEGPKNNMSGGMEYPMVTLITSPDVKAESLDAVITHEVGHNWFMAMLGSNERAHAWMDEGLNSYFQFRYEAYKYKMNSIFGDEIPADVKNNTPAKFQELLYTVMGLNIPMEDEMEKSSEKFADSDAYAMASYIKPAVWMYNLEASVGWEKVREAFHNYFNEWKFKHPQPADLQASFEKTMGGSLEDFFQLINRKGKLY